MKNLTGKRRCRRLFPRRCQRPATGPHGLRRLGVPMEFSCTARQADGRVLLTVSGDVDLAAHARFQEAAEPWTAAPNDVVLDLSGVTFLDSMGLRVLVHLR